jgi:hypothetical protein
MKSLVEKINEAKAEYNKDNLLAIMCMVETIANDGNYSSSIKANKLKPSISEQDAYDAAQILMNQTIWKIN